MPHRQSPTHDSRPSAENNGSIHPIDACVRKPVTVAVCVLLVMLFGAISLMRMPMQLTPEVQRPEMSIETYWPGASPQEIEREIVQEQEEFLKGVENSTKMTSECMDSFGRITIEFAVGTDISAMMVPVETRLQQVRDYPEDADKPVIRTSSVSGRSIAWFILSPRMATDEEFDDFIKSHPDKASLLDPIRNAPGHGLALMRLRNLAQEDPAFEPLLPADIDVTKMRKFAEEVIEARFERVEGVAGSNIMGGREIELQVVVDPHLLAARQLTISDLRTAIRSQNKDTSGGDFWEGKRRWVVRVPGRFRSPEDVESLLVAVRNDAPVFLRDVAEVRIGYKKPTGVVRRYGAAAIAVNAQREPGANVLDVMDGLRSAAKELNDYELSRRGLQLTQVYDETDYIYSAVGLVNQNIVVGGILTICVLLLFLRSGRSTLVIGLAIPSSIVGTFLLLHLAGRSLNVISLAGLAFAVGMLVDNAVVVLENIYRHYQNGDKPFTAAVAGAKEVWGAVIASTLTTLAVFLPILFVQEEAGQLFRDIALAISFAVGFSLLVSVSVIPTAAARLFRHRQQLDLDDTSRHKVASTNGWLNKIDHQSQRFVTLVVDFNEYLQQTMTRRIVAVVVLVGAAVVLTWALRPKIEYLPTGNRNLAFGIIMPPPGYNMDEMMELGQIVEDAIRPYWDFEPEALDDWKLDYPPIQDFFFVARGRSIFVGLRAVDATKARAFIPLLQEVGKKMPGIIMIANQSSLFESGLGSGRAIDVEITGPELTKLVDIGGQIMRQVTAVPELPALPLIPGVQARPIPSLDLKSPEVHIERKPFQAAELGVDSTSLGYAVNAFVDGAYADDFFLEGQKIDLTIMGKAGSTDPSRDFRRHYQDLGNIPVATPSGSLVTLNDLADIRLTSGPEQINRRERQRAITIQVRPPDEISMEAALRVLNEDVIGPMQENGSLDEYQITLSGTADKLRDTWAALKWNLLLAILITYLLMAALFESWLYPFVIILSVPLGAVGGVLGLRGLSVYQQWMGGPPQSLDVLTMLGFIILIGTVVNNAILIVHQSLNHMRNDRMNDREAILESVRTRIRPIFMTTTTTVCGLAPLVFFPGAGSELYRGLGSVVLGGLVVSTLFTLVLVPTLFSLMLDIRAYLVLKLFGPQPSIASDTPDESFRVAE